MRSSILLQRMAACFPLPLLHLPHIRSAGRFLPAICFSTLISFSDGVFPAVFKAELNFSVISLSVFPVLEENSSCRSALLSRKLRSPVTTTRSSFMFASSSSHINSSPMVCLPDEVGGLPNHFLLTAFSHNPS